MRSVLITGANGGIGQSLCQVFKEADYLVTATDIQEKSNCDCDNYIPFDLAKIHNQDDLNTFISFVQSKLKNQKLNTLINNAALQVLGDFSSLEFSDWLKSLNVNLLAPVAFTKALLPNLIAANGSVINISSIHAHQTKPGFTCYSTSKAALTGLTQSLAVEIGSKVRVNAILPAATETPMLKAGFADNPSAYKQLSSMHPVGRIAKPSEVAKTALFLAGDETSIINGALIEVDGGISKRLHDPS